MLRIGFLLLLACTPLRAHSGHESEIALSVRPHQLRVVLRCDPDLAWSFLDARPPQTSLESSFTAAAPRLRKLAPELLVLRNGESPLKPRAVQVELEPGRRVAFVFTFPAPDGPLRLLAPFLDKPDHLHPATVRLYDRREFRRDARPVATLELQRPDQAIEFTAESAEPIDP